MNSQPKELREAYAQFDASHPWPTLHEAYIHAWHAAIAALGAQKPVAYLHYAAKKPSLRELSFSADPNALQVASGWKSKPLFVAAPSPQEDAP